MKKEQEIKIRHENSKISKLINLLLKKANKNR